MKRVLRLIFANLDFSSLANVFKACRLWRDAVCDPFLVALVLEDSEVEQETPLSSIPHLFDQTRVFRAPLANWSVEILLPRVEVVIFSVATPCQHEHVQILLARFFETCTSNQVKRVRVRSTGMRLCHFFCGGEGQFLLAGLPGALDRFFVRQECEVSLEGYLDPSFRVHSKDGRLLAVCFVPTDDSCSLWTDGVCARTKLQDTDFCFMVQKACTETFAEMLLRWDLFDDHGLWIENRVWSSENLRNRGDGMGCGKLQMWSSHPGLFRFQPMMVFEDSDEHRFEKAKEERLMWCQQMEELHKGRLK